jgi:hypothetical protein
MDPFTLQYLVGHDNIKTAMRCLHPWPTPCGSCLCASAAWSAGMLGAGLAAKCSEKNEYTGTGPQQRLPVKQLKTKAFLSAEVVKLADTPS